VQGRAITVASQHDPGREYYLLSACSVALVVIGLLVLLISI
jgi:hypothetical protein